MTSPEEKRPTEVMLIEFGEDGARLRFWLLGDDPAAVDAIAEVANRYGRLAQDDVQPPGVNGHRR